MTNRRVFIGRASAATAGLTFLRNVHAQPLGATGDLRFGVVGARGKGRGHIRHLLKQEGVRVAGVCDVDKQILESRAKSIADEKQVVTPYVDYRRLCADPNIDAVVIATPNHLHTLIALTAIQNGKHVYVEKPVSWNHRESMVLTAAAEKYPELVVQHGMQRRSDTGWMEAMEYINSGALGAIKYSRGFCYKPRKSIGRVSKPQPVPEHIDYNLWSGPREMLPVMRRSFHYDWHWQWPYGNGDIGNQGPHQMDVARWALGQPHCAPRVISVGGRFGYDDDGDSANTQIAFFDYKPAPLIFEVRGLPNSQLDWGKGMPNYKGVRVGNVIECEGGYVAESKAYDKNGKSIRKFGITNGAGHMENFIAQIRNGTRIENCLVKQGSVSASLCHAANISLRLGLDKAPGEIKEALSDDAGISETFDRFVEHLAANGVDVKKVKPTLGPWLTLDPSTETYTGAFADHANKLAQGTYRSAFQLPQI